jgi:hypothetical protein
VLKKEMMFLIGQKGKIPQLFAIFFIISLNISGSSLL